MDCGSVLVADEDAQFRRFVGKRLSRIGYAVRGAATGVEALAAARRRRPAVVILDVKLPEISGYQVCRELRDVYGNDPVIIFVSSERTESYDRVGGLLIGADDYLAKPVDADELIARVHRLSTRSQPAPTPTPEESRNGHGLTRRELEVLRLLARGLRQGEIATTLFISPKTVSTHIQHILAKLDVHSRVEAVALAHQQGLTGTVASRGSGRAQ